MLAADKIAVTLTKKKFRKKKKTRCNNSENLVFSLYQFQKAINNKIEKTNKRSRK